MSNLYKAKAAGGIDVVCLAQSISRTPKMEPILVSLIEDRHEIARHSFIRTAWLSKAGKKLYCYELP